MKVIAKKHGREQVGNSGQNCTLKRPRPFWLNWYSSFLSQPTPRYFLTPIPKYSVDHNFVGSTIIQCWSGSCSKHWRIEREGVYEATSSGTNSPWNFCVVGFVRGGEIKTPRLHEFLRHQVRSIVSQVMGISNQQFTRFIGNPRHSISYQKC